MTITNTGKVILFTDKRPAALMETISELVQPSILQMLNSGIRVGHREAITYQVGSGGKRIRPTLAVLSCLMLGGSLEDVVHAAASLEVLHNATLITDDIIDHGETRRGLPTTWKKHGQAFAECAALAYTVSVYEGLAIQGRLDLAPILTSAMKSIVDGELMDILFDASGREDEAFIAEKRPTSVGISDYEEMVALKTAQLFVASAELGGACANGSEGELEALREYGFNLGMLFQVQDDILDIYGDEKEFGKQIGKDILEHKRGNIVLLQGLKHMNPPTRHKCDELLGKNDISEDDIANIVCMLDSAWARKTAEALADKYATAATAALVGLPDNSWNRALGDIVQYCRGRCR